MAAIADTICGTHVKLSVAKKATLFSQAVVWAAMWDTEFIATVGIELPCWGNQATPHSLLSTAVQL